MPLRAMLREARDRPFPAILPTLPEMSKTERDLDREIDVLIQMSDLSGPMPLVREALATLGQIQHERAVTTLAARVSELEDALIGTTELPHDPDDMRALLDSVISLLARIPPSLDFERAAAVPLAALTAWQALRDDVKLKSGDEVLVNGAAGGVGSFAVQRPTSGS